LAHFNLEEEEEVVVVVVVGVEISQVRQDAFNSKRLSNQDHRC